MPAAPALFPALPVPPSGPRGPSPALAPHAVTSRRPARLTGGVACLVLGIGLLGGTAAGTWLTGGDERPTAAQTRFDEGRSLWREVPVDGLFPPELVDADAGPGGARRRWIRVAVAPAGGCADAFDPVLSGALSSVGCHRLVRATYTDETRSSVTTVGLLFTEAAPADMRRLHRRFAADGLAERSDVLPRTYPAAGTPAEDFGDAQRAAWTLRTLTDLPVVVFAVTGFADGRTVAEPQAASEATAPDADTAVALAGLGHEAEGIADRVERGLYRASRRQTGEQR